MREFDLKRFIRHYISKYNLKTTVTDFHKDEVLRIQFYENLNVVMEKLYF